MMLSQLSQRSVPVQTGRSEALFVAWDSFFVPFSKSPPLTCGFAAVPCPTPVGGRPFVGQPSPGCPADRTKGAES